MDKEAVKKYLLDSHSRKLPSLKKRGIVLKDSPKIQTVIGARRTGKTYLLFNKIEQLMAVGVPREQIIYLNFENPVLCDISFKEFSDIMQIYYSIFPQVEGKKTYLFIDEPQVIPKWELSVRALYDENRYLIFITGSSSRLLSKEIATSLRGRSLSTTLLPLSFNEFLDFKGLKINASRLSSRDISILLNALDEFIKFGGYPEIALESDISERLRIFKDYFDLTIYKDIVERYAVKNIHLIRWFINYLIAAAAREINLNKIYTTLKSQGMKLSKNTLYEYFSVLEDCFFILPLRKIGNSVRKEGLSFPKVYLNDCGFLNLFGAADYGKQMENAVYLELVRRSNLSPLMKINYWRSDENKEVDFIVSHGGEAKEAIQVCYAFKDEQTREREISALTLCLKAFGLKEGLIISRDYEAVEKFDGFMIKIVPVWKWFL